MTEITIDRLTRGMTLACDVVHANGRVLLEAGATIAPNHLRMLKAWGVSAVEVDPASLAGASGLPEGVDPEQYQAACEAVAAEFRHADLSHPVVAELFRYRVGKTL